jgi:RNA polymerase sigma-70 factor (ECF subfamily)
VGTGWEEVYATSYRRLVVLLSAVAGSRAEAEEAVQEAFVRALGLTGRRGVVDDPEGWLYRVATNVLRSRWRRVLAARRATARLAAGESGALSGLDGHSGHDGHDGTDARLALLAALRRLPYGQREALALHYLADLPLEAIAARTGAPLGTVKARLSRGRDALAKLLDEERVGGAHGV